MINLNVFKNHSLKRENSEVLKFCLFSLLNKCSILDPLKLSDSSSINWPEMGWSQIFDQFLNSLKFQEIVKGKNYSSRNNFKQNAENLDYYLQNK